MRWWQNGMEMIKLCRRNTVILSLKFICFWKKKKIQLIVVCWMNEWTWANINLHFNFNRVIVNAELYIFTTFYIPSACTHQPVTLKAGVFSCFRCWSDKQNNLESRSAQAQTDQIQWQEHVNENACWNYFLIFRNTSRNTRNKRWLSPDPVRFFRELFRC